MNILNVVDSLDETIEQSEIESLFCLLEYYNKGLTMSIYLESDGVQPQTNQQTQKPSIFEKLWNGIKRLFEIVKNAFNKFFNLFKKKPFKVQNETKAIMSESPDAATNDAKALEALQRIIDKFKQSNPNATINGVEVVNDIVNIYTKGSDDKWYFHKFSLDSQEPIQEAAVLEKIASPIMTGVQQASRIGSLTGNAGLGVAVGAGSAALSTANTAAKAALSALSFPIGILAGFAIGKAFSICANALEKMIINKQTSLPQPDVIKRAGNDLIVQSDSFYTIMTNLKLNTNVEILAKPIYEYIKHDKFDHTGENCITVMDNWLKRATNDPVISNMINGNGTGNQVDLNNLQLQMITDAGIYIQLLNTTNGDAEILQMFNKLNESYDKTNKFIQSPDCIINKIPSDQIKQTISNVLTKNAKQCLVFINCLNTIKSIGTSIWENITIAKNKINNNNNNNIPRTA